MRNLPLADAMMRRLGLTDRYADRASWTPGMFLIRQLHRAGVASAPYAVAGFAEYDAPPLEPSPPMDASPPSLAWAAWGVAATVAALAAAALAVPPRFRLPTASVVLAGFCWALAARGNSFEESHSYEGLFYIGLPLALWSGALIGARRLLGDRLGGAVAIAAAAVAAPVFALSALDAGRIRTDEYAAKRSQEIMADMDAIGSVVSGKDVILSSDAWQMVNYYDVSGSASYYLAGSYLWEGAGLDLRGGADAAAWTHAWRNGARFLGLDSREADAEYAVSRYRNAGAGLLTPDNRHLFLYASADLARLHQAERRRLESSEPAARADFDVYLEGSALRYLKTPCAPGDADAFFFAHFFPAGDAYPRHYGSGGDIHGANFPFVKFSGDFDGVNFPFVSSGAYFDDACLATANLPPYPVAAIRTGQYISDSPAGAERGGEAWEVSIFPPPSAETLAIYESAYRAIADSEPAAQSAFDLYLDADGGALSYLKQPCSQEDARGRFFLSVHPARAADLPPDRRQTGHESLNFDFEPPRAVVFNGKCMATIQLPDYEIAKIETGQWIPNGERLWGADITVGD